MKLAEWIRNSGKTLNEVAAGIEARSLTTVHRYKSGEQVPGPRMMVNIFVFTDGSVQPNDFYDLPRERLAP